MTDPKRILVVEDEKPMSKALQLKLTKAGFYVQAAFNGEEALAILDREDFDLMFLDLIMPIVDGFTVLTNLKEKKKKPIIVVTSNLSQEEDAIRAKELGAIDYIVKSDTPLASLVEYAQKLLSV